MPSFLSILAPPMLLLITLPLAFFAFLTTTLAIVALLARVSIVYVELGAALLHAYIFTSGTSQKKTGKHNSHLNNNCNTTVLSQTYKSRRRSDASFVSQAGGLERSINSDSFASLLGAGAQGPARDFEGIGGWRDEASNPSEEALWISMNSRLELPAAVPPPERARRHHKRSLTGQSQMSGSMRSSGIWSPEMLRMSPVQSRARTPSVTEMRVYFEAGGGGGGMTGEEEYFSLMPHGKRGSGGEAIAVRRKSVSNGGAGEKRRKSMSGDSISSMGSSRGSRGTVKAVGNG